jgi:hypothetical protein
MKTKASIRYGSMNNQCPSCGLMFKAVYAFDLHRTGPFNARKCLTEDQLLTKGLTPNYTGLWRFEKHENES